MGAKKNRTHICGNWEALTTRGKAVSQTSLPDKPRIRHKNEFLEGGNPAKALLEFFDSVGAGARVEHQSARVRSLPLILISQLPRSGGSLLSQLLDGHPQLHVYPWEMKIGYPSKGRWPTLDLDKAPDHLFATLFHAELAYLAKKGYRKMGKARQKQQRLSFDYAPLEHYRNFVRLIPDHRTQRDVLDTYFSTLFQAWQPEVKDATYIAGFVPRMARYRHSIAGFFRDYPDGRLISIMRDPADWFASRRAHTAHGLVRYGDIKEEMRVWNRMAKAALEYRRVYRDKCLLLSFKEVVADREATMRSLCGWCGIKFRSELLQQTFDGRPVGPNTNFHDPVEELPKAVLERKNGLTEIERQQARELTEIARKELQAIGWIG